MQAYDGASVISGRCTDVQKKVMEVVPQAAYRTWSCWTVFFFCFFFFMETGLCNSKGHKKIATYIRN